MSSPPDDEENVDPLFGEEPPVGEDATRDPRGFVPEFVRKVAVAGLGALFMTEEGIRSLAGQLKLPKEVLGFILSHAEKTKDDIGRVVSEEVRRFLQSEKLREEFVKLMAGMTVEIKAEVRLKPTEPGGDGTPQITVTDIGTKKSRRKRE
jgi:hypothetical protein